MAILLTILTALLPFGLAVVLSQVLLKAINPSILPKSFVFRQLVYAFLLLPFIDFFARIWLLQPFVPILALASAGVSGVSAALFWLLNAGATVANQAVTFTSSLGEIADYTKNEMISVELKQTWQDLSVSMQDVFSNINYTQLSEDLLSYSVALQGVSTKTNESNYLAYKAVWNNFTKNPIVKEASSNLSSIVNNSLHSIHLTDFVTDGHSLKPESLVFDQVIENLILIVNSLSFEDVDSWDSLLEMTSELSTYANIVGDGLKSLRLSFRSRTQDLISNTTLTGEAKETFGEILHVISGEHTVADAFQSLLLTPWSSTKESYTAYDAYNFIGIKPRWIVAIFVIALISMPFMYIGRAFLQSWVQWHLSKTYRDFGNEAERKIDGYILTGGITGIGYGAAQATIQAFLWEYGPFSVQAKFVLLTHGAMLMIIHCVTQMAISSAEGRRDLIRQWKGRKSWWILATIVNVVLGAWWTGQFVATLVCAAQEVDVALKFLLAGDAIVLAILMWWMKSICERARTEEQLNSSKRD